MANFRFTSIKYTYNQDVDSEALSQTLPDQLVFDLTFFQQPLHHWDFLCRVWPQVGFGSWDAFIWWVHNVRLAEQSLPFHTGAVGHVTRFIAWLERWCVRAQERRVVCSVGHSETQQALETANCWDTSSLGFSAVTTPEGNWPWLFLTSDWLLHFFCLQLCNANRICVLKISYKTL